MSEEETTLELQADLVAVSDGGIVPSELFSGERSFESLSKAELDVLAERFRQVSEEGFTPEKDDAYVQGELARAAGCYALGPKLVPIDGRCAESARPAWWPWDRAWWKPKGRRADLVRAGALIIAEIERMDREEARWLGEAGEGQQP